LLFSGVVFADEDGQPFRDPKLQVFVFGTAAENAEILNGQL